MISACSAAICKIMLFKYHLLTLYYYTYTGAPNTNMHIHL